LRRRSDGAGTAAVEAPTRIAERKRIERAPMRMREAHAADAHA
jgi:hypothetical protein